MDCLQFYVSSVLLGKFNDRLSHYYGNLPDTVPEFLHINGPDPAVVQRNSNGQSWQKNERLVMSAYLLTIEPS